MSIMLAFYPPFVLSSNEKTDFAAIGQGMSSAKRGVLRGGPGEFALEIEHTNYFTVSGKLPPNLPTGTYDPVFFDDAGQQFLTSGVKFAVVHIPGG